MIAETRVELEERYQPQIKSLTQENSQYKTEIEICRKDAERRMINHDDQVNTLLGSQLREMTKVLEEFDEKYTRKEKQLKIARDQNKQLK